MALTFDVIQPKKPNGAGVLFMMSGGWFSMWVPPESFVEPEARRMASSTSASWSISGYTLFIVRHGSAPQFKVPEAVADVRRAVRYIRLQRREVRHRSGSDRRLRRQRRRPPVADARHGVRRRRRRTPRTKSTAASNRVAAVVAYFPPVDLREWVGPNDRFPALRLRPEAGRIGLAAAARHARRCADAAHPRRQGRPGEARQQRAHPGRASRRTRCRAT